MTLATKNNSLIVKNGKVAENCGCCGCTPAQALAVYSAITQKNVRARVNGESPSGETPFTDQVNQFLRSHGTHGDGLINAWHTLALDLSGTFFNSQTGDFRVLYSLLHPRWLVSVDFVPGTKPWFSSNPCGTRIGLTFNSRPSVFLHPPASAVFVAIRGPTVRHWFNWSIAGVPVIVPEFNGLGSTFAWASRVSDLAGIQEDSGVPGNNAVALGTFGSSKQLDNESSYYDSATVSVTRPILNSGLEPDYVYSLAVVQGTSFDVSGNRFPAIRGINRTLASFEAEIS